MASSFGGSVKLTGESEYQKALRGISDNLKVLNSEMKTVTSQYDRNDKSVENLSSQNDVLNKKIEEQEKKVGVLKDALEAAKKETGENSDTTKKWQTELNNAQADLNKLNREVDNNSKAMEEAAQGTKEEADAVEDFGKEAEKSGEKALSLGDIIKANLISDAIKGGIKALAGAMKEVGSAFVDIGKQAIESYADYEQLVGGVETLFAKTDKSYAEMYDEGIKAGKTLKEINDEWFKSQSAIDRVLENANDAYKTSGMSANEYMEVVTGFSASLISSLGGDTEKASELANVAIVDMSDNANKMGTDIESLKNAYSGFAKGQYNMLDNLKLGYGGTKTEMERLLADAEKLPSAMGKKFDISNYGDVVEAIHLVQENMGIAGTTAREASTTISGSLSAMKSAWQNVLSGIANEDADFEQLVGNLVESIVGEDGEGGVLNNILPRIEVAFDGIVTLIVSLVDTLLPTVVEMGMGIVNNLVQSIAESLPELLESAKTMLTTILNGIATALPQLVPAAMEISKTLITTILENLPMILEMGIQILVSLIQGITDTLPSLIPTIIDAVILMVDTLLDNIDLIIDSGIELILALADGLLDALPDLVEKIPEIIDKLLDAIFNNFPKILEAGIEITLALADGLVDALPQLLGKLPEIIRKIVKGLKESIPQLIKAGGDLLAGLFEGLLNPKTIWNAVKDLFKGIVGGIKELFGIHSPSRVFKDEVGANLALGLGEGFEDTMNDVSSEMASAIPTEFDADISANMNASSAASQMSTYDMMVSAFKQALTEVKVVMDDREMGGFVTNTVERVVFA